MKKNLVPVFVALHVLSLGFSSYLFFEAHRMSQQIELNESNNGIHIANIKQKSDEEIIPFIQANRAAIMTLVAYGMKMDLSEFDKLNTARINAEKLAQVEAEITRLSAEKQTKEVKVELEVLMTRREILQNALGINNSDETNKK